MIAKFGIANVVDSCRACESQDPSLVAKMSQCMNGLGGLASRCMQVYAGVCRCMQVYADVCRCMQMYAVAQCVPSSLPSPAFQEAEFS